MEKTPRKKLNSLKILIVDDQNDIRILIRDILSESGIMHIFEAANGEEALHFLGQDFGTVDFIICDWDMPGITGLDLLRQVRVSHPAMPFLMVTGRGDRNSVIEAKDAGVSAFIKKPFSPKQLEDKVKALILPA